MQTSPSPDEINGIDLLNLILISSVGRQSDALAYDIRHGLRRHLYQSAARQSDVSRTDVVHAVNMPCSLSGISLTNASCVHSQSDVAQASVSCVISQQQCVGLLRHLCDVGLTNMASLVTEQRDHDLMTAAASPLVFIC